MAITITTCRNDYVGNNTTAIFPYTFKIRAASDLVVISKDLGNVEHVLTLTTDYTVSGLGAIGGGNVTLTAGNLATGVGLDIRRVRPLTQTTSIRNETEYYQATIEDALDNLLMIDQQQEGEITRALKVAVTDSAALNPTISPIMSYMGLYVLRLNAGLTALEWVSPLVAYAQAILGINQVMTLTNNSSGVVAGAIQSNTTIRSWIFNWTVFRSTSLGSKAQSGSEFVVFDGTNWTLTDGPMSGADGGVTFTINVSTGQISYATDNQAGTVVSQKLTWSVSNLVGV